MLRCSTRGARPKELPDNAVLGIAARRCCMAAGPGRPGRRPALCPKIAELPAVPGKPARRLRPKSVVKPGPRSPVQITSHNTRPKNDDDHEAIRSAPCPGRG